MTLESILAYIAIALSVFVILEILWKTSTGKGLVSRAVPDAVVDKFSPGNSFQVTTYSTEEKNNKKVHTQYEFLRNVRLTELGIKIREATDMGLGVRIELDIPRKKLTDKI